MGIWSDDVNVNAYGTYADYHPELRDKTNKELEEEIEQLKAEIDELKRKFNDLNHIVNSITR